MATDEGDRLPPALAEWVPSLVKTVKDYAVFVMDPDGIIGTWNLGVEHVLGYTAEEYIGRHFSICYSPEDVASGKPERELRIAAAEGRYEEQGWRLRKGGVRFWADEVITALYDDAREVKGFGKVVRDLTDRRETEEVLRLAVEHALDGVITIDERGVVQTFNKQAEKTFGYPASEVIGRNVNMLMPEPYHSEHDGYIANYLRTGVAKIIGIGREVEGRRKDGSTFPLQLVVSEFQLHDRRHFTGSVRDITAFRRRLRQQEAVAQLGQVALTSDDLPEVMNRVVEIVSHVLDTEFVKVLELLPDRHALVLRAGVGWTEGLVGRATVDAGPNTQAGYTLSSAGPVVVDDLRTETRFTAPSLLTEHGVVSGMSVVVQGRDRPFGVFGAHSRQHREFGPHDVNFLQSAANVLAVFIQRHELEAALRRTHAELRQVVEANIVGIIFWTDDTCIAEANDYFLDLVGLRREDIAAGKVCWPDLTPPEHRPADDRAMEEIRETGRFAPFEKEYFRKDGSRVPVLVGGALLQGETNRGVALILDLTERKNLERQFRQSQKMEAVGQLAGGVAHDFNNLLTVISGYSDLLLERLPPADPNRVPIQEIHKAGERAASLTRQLLAFSRQQVLEPKVLDLNSIVADTERMLRRLIGEDVQLATATAAALRPVKVDAGQMEQVILNLAVNARDAMPKGGKLTIETANVDLDEEYAARRPEVKPGQYIMLAVSDTGTGMTPEVQARIFEPFFTTKGPGKGTGLGLATVYGIVKQSGGYVSVHSEPGRGTTFKIYLPAAEEQVATGKSVHGLEVSVKGNETILVAEDEGAVRAIIRLVLRSYGYTVLEAGSGAVAVRVAETHPGPIHLLVTDVVMPEMGGRELAERLTALRPGLKVLYLSGYTDDAVVRHGVLEAHTHFLQKPFTPGKLAAIIREVLDEQ